MSFLRKASLLRKKSSDDVPSSKSPHVRGEKPPRTRAVSEANPRAENGEDSKVKRRVSIGHNSRKRISSLFSSSSLSTDSSDRENNASPARPTSHLNVSTTSSSSISAPVQEVAPTPVNRSYSGLSGKGAPPHMNGNASVSKVNEDPEIPPTDLPESPLVSATVPGPPQQPTSAAGSPERLRKARPTSMYSQWDEEARGDSSEEDGAFLTPDEGLSEVEEEEGEVEAVPTSTVAHTPTAARNPNAVPSPSRAQNQTSVPNSSAAPADVDKGVIADKGDVSGTGASTIHRSLPTSGETKVEQRTVTKGDALMVDQAGLLFPDLAICREILTLFLTSKMKEAEDLCFEKDPDGTHLYMNSAHSIIQGLKGMMTFDSVDLANALEICKATSVTASALRKPAEGMITRLGGLVKAGAGVQRIKSMTVLERHAELVFAETSLMKAMLAIVSGGDWLGLVREAFNMRTAHGIYRTLQQYLDEMDRGGYDDDIDMDFRSGVWLGTGTSSLMLSLLPGKVLKVAEVFGYAGDRKFALPTLMAAGGWSKDSDQPEYTEQNEGIRRPVCDMILLTFHLVISVLMPVDGVDMVAARKILAYNVKRYPDGVFFLYFQARLHTSQCEPELANKSLQRALDLKLEYIQLQHMCLWDYGVNYLMLANWKGSLDCFSILKEESNWSRAVYTYAAAACIIELVEDGDPDAKLEEADLLMKQVPNLTKKIAGKSLPIEKLSSRKARKFNSQGHRLFLPAMELAYLFGALSHTPRRDLLAKHLPRINKMLAKLEASTPETYGNGNEYWDDYCLGHFLRGVVQFVARYEPEEAVESAKAPRPGEPPDDEIDHGVEKDFQAVLRHGPDVQLDHFIVYHCHYELGRLYSRRGDMEQARRNFNVVMSGRLPEVNQYEKKTQGKYSLEGALLLKTHAALQGLKEGEAV